MNRPPRVKILPPSGFMLARGLARWFALWHPRYRWLIGQLFLAGTFAAGLVYVENFLLTSLTLSLAATGPQVAGPAVGSSGIMAQAGALPQFLYHFAINW